MRLGLLSRKQLGNHAAGHWKQAVLYACHRIRWMQHQLRLLWLLHIQEARNDIGLQHVTIEVCFNALAQCAKLCRPIAIVRLHRR